MYAWDDGNPRQMFSALLLERQKDIPQELIDEAINTRRGAKSGFAHSRDICSWAALQSGPNLLSPSTGALDTPQDWHCPSLPKPTACAFCLVIWQVNRYVLEAKTDVHQGKLCTDSVLVAQCIASMPSIDQSKVISYRDKPSGDLQTCVRLGTTLYVRRFFAEGMVNMPSTKLCQQVKGHVPWENCTPCVRPGTRAWKLLAYAGRAEKDAHIAAQSFSSDQGQSTGSTLEALMASDEQEVGALCMVSLDAASSIPWFKAGAMDPRQHEWIPAHHQWWLRASAAHNMQLLISIAHILQCKACCKAKQTCCLLVLTRQDVQG